MSWVFMRIRCTICAAVSLRSLQGFSGNSTMPVLTSDWRLKLPVRWITRVALPRATSSLAISATCVR